MTTEVNAYPLWVLVGPVHGIEDGPVAMPISTAMGYNQMRAANHMGARWEEYNPEAHGSLAQVQAALDAIEAEYGVQDGYTPGFSEDSQ